MVFGIFGEELEVSRIKHKVDESSEGLDIRTFTRQEKDEYLDIYALKCLRMMKQKNYLKQIM